MGRHSAERISARDLRRSYTRLREAYERLLRDHVDLKNAHHGLLDPASGGPSSLGAEVTLWQPGHGPVQSQYLAVGEEPMSVETACDLVRSSGLLTSPGLET